MTLQQKLKDFRNSLNLNQTEFAEALGTSQSAIANIESGKRDVSKPVLIKIKEVYNVDLLSYNEIKKENKTQYSDNTIPIPFYSAKVSAGLGATLPDYPEKDVIYYDKRVLQNLLGVKPEHASFIRVTGDSMEGGNSPIKDGDIILIDDSVKEIINGEVFVIQLNKSELVVKKVIKEWDGTVKLISNNPKYEDRIIKENEEAEIIGKVVCNPFKRNV